MEGLGLGHEEVPEGGQLTETRGGAGADDRALRHEVSEGDGGGVREGRRTRQSERGKGKVEHYFIMRKGVTRGSEGWTDYNWPCTAAENTDDNHRRVHCCARQVKVLPNVHWQLNNTKMHNNGI